MRFWPGCVCCASPSCLIGEDDFVRDDGDPGVDWDKRPASSSYVISSNNLVTDMGNDLIIYNTAHPDGLAEHRVYVLFTCPSENDTFRVIVAYTDDDNYLAIEVEYGGSEYEGRLRALHMNGGSITQLGCDRAAYLDAGFDAHIWVCYDGSTLSALVQAAPGDADKSGVLNETVASPTAGTKVGLGTGDTLSTNATTYTFSYSKLYSATNPDCDTCPTAGQCDACLNNELPPQFEVSIVGATCTGGSNIDGTYYCSRSNDAGNVVLCTGIYNPCYWLSEPFVIDGLTYYIAVVIGSTDGGYLVSVSAKSGTWIATAADNVYASKFDCLAFDEESVGSNANCSSGQQYCTFDDYTTITISSVCT